MPPTNFCKICGHKRFYHEEASAEHCQNCKCHSSWYYQGTYERGWEPHFEWFILNGYSFRVEIDYEKNLVRGFFPFVKGFGNCISYKLDEFEEKFGEFDPKKPSMFLNKLKTIIMFS